MALVSYDYSSESDNENEELSESVRNSSINNEIYTKVNSSPARGRYDNRSDEINPDVVGATTSTIFSNLPRKKIEVHDILEDKVEDFIPKAHVPKTQKSKVKISIPSLSEFDDLGDIKAKRQKPYNKGSGLLSLLPPVKCVPLSNVSFIPNILSQKRKATVLSEKNEVKVNNKSQTKILVDKQITYSKEKDGSDDDIELPETFDEELWKKTCGKVTKQKIKEPEPVIEEPSINIAPVAIQPYEGLNNEAFKELVGIKSRIPRNVKLIDVNEDELVAEKDLWMTKSLTDPECVPKKSEEEPVDPTKRKKHHITYLAQQAKANEQELQSQWSSSKFNRNQARAKYGF